MLKMMNFGKHVTSHYADTQTLRVSVSVCVCVCVCVCGQRGVKMFVRLSRYFFLSSWGY